MTVKILIRIENVSSTFIVISLCIIFMGKAAASHTAVCLKIFISLLQKEKHWNFGKKNDQKLPAKIYNSKNIIYKAQWLTNSRAGSLRF